MGKNQILRNLHKRGRARFYHGIDLHNFFPALARCLSEKQLTENVKLILDKLQWALWDSLSSGMSPGSSLQKLSDFLGPHLIVLTCIESIQFARKIDSEKINWRIANSFDKTLKYFEAGEVPVNERSALEAERTESFYQTRVAPSTLDLAMYYGIVSIQCFLLREEFDEQDEIVYAAKAIHAVWRALNNDHAMLWHNVALRLTKGIVDKD